MKSRKQSFGATFLAVFASLVIAAVLFAQSTATTGRIGVGTTAQLPATCSAGDIWDATDSPFAISKCGTGNVWNAVGMPTTTIKQGSGSGTYSGPASTAFQDIDSTNLSYTTPIPVGWKLLVSASGSYGTQTAVDYVEVRLTDGGIGILGSGKSAFSSTIGVSIGFSTSTVIVGDGASHTIRLQAAALTAAHAYQVENSSTTFTPVMVFILSPSN